MLKQFITLSLGAAMLAGLWACDSTGKEQVTEGGAKYTFIEDKKGDSTAKEGQIMTLRFSLFMKGKNGKDTLMQSSAMAPNGEIPMPVKKAAFKGSFEEVLTKLTEGDSVNILIEADSMVTMLSMGKPLPEFIDPKTDIRLNLRVVKIMSEQAYSQKQQQDMMAQQQEMMKKQTEADPQNQQQIALYLSANGLKTQTTESGLHYIITNPGSGASPQPGQLVSVHYTGTLLDGKKFDSSRDRNQPLEFSHKTGQMIPGFDEGVGMLKKGGKATLLIPSKLGYGAQPAGEIPPFSVLKFEIEIVDIKDAPKQDAAGQHSPGDGHNH